MSHVTTHVLDSSVGRPAAGVAVELQDARGSVIDTGVTDADGRVSAIGPELLAPAAYRLVFDTGAYFAATGTATFYPRVALDFTVADSAHYHVPLLLGPFAYSTYRGS